MKYDIRVPQGAAWPICSRPAATKNYPTYPATQQEIDQWAYAAARKASYPVISLIHTSHATMRGALVEISDDWNETMRRMSSAQSAIYADCWAEHNLAQAMNEQKSVQFYEAQPFRAELTTGGGYILLSLCGHFDVALPPAYGPIGHVGHVGFLNTSPLVCNPPQQWIVGPSGPSCDPGSIEQTAPEPEADAPVKIKFREFL